MKRFLLFLVCTVYVVGLNAQDEPKTPPVKPKSGIASGLVLFTDIWQEDIADMDPRTINQGVDAYVNYNVPVQNSPLSFSLGTGVMVHNLYSNCVLVQDSTDDYSFVKISDLDTTQQIDYKKSKLSVAYWDFPMEFRYRNKAGFTFAIGMKFGLNINAMTKYKGDDYLGLTNDDIIFKVKDLEHLVKWRYGFTGRLGYKMVELFYFYSITDIFSEGKGPEIAPMSLGISIRPLLMESKK